MNLTKLGMLKLLIEGEKSILIFGAGNFGKRLYDWLNLLGEDNKVIAWIDNDVSKQGGELKGRPIVSLDDAFSQDFGSCSIWIASVFADEMMEKIVQWGGHSQGRRCAHVL